MPSGPWPSALSVGMGFVQVGKICIHLLYIIHPPAAGASMFKSGGHSLLGTQFDLSACHRGACCGRGGHPCTGLCGHCCVFPQGVLGRGLAPVAST